MAKRDAVTAFDGTGNEIPHSSKRQRQKHTRESTNQSDLLSAKAKAHSASAVAETPKKSDKSNGPSTAASMGMYEVTPQLSRAENEKSQSSPSKSRSAVEVRPQEKENKINSIVSEETKKNTSKALVTKSKDSKIGSVAGSKFPKAQPDNTSKWPLSQGSGGIFIDQDPIFTEDKQHLILATHTDVRVYSLKTSLLVRTFQVGNKSEITSCALSMIDPKKLYISTVKGLLSVCDWTNGTSIAKHETGRAARKILPINSHEGQETILAVHQNDQKSVSVVAYALDTTSAILSQLQPILKKNFPKLPVLQAHARGSILVACAFDKILVGQSQISEIGTLDLNYTWREIVVPGTITSLDSQINVGKSKSSRKMPFLDIAVGLDTGAIIHYEDLLFRLIGKEKKNSNEDIVGRRLHWHRSSVNTLKWSRDRNYLISGGNETVLVIWQLDTNQQQFLPHLSTAIVNLSISAAGSSYALRMADNSVMVLSTADLLPSTNISGLAVGNTPSQSSTTVLHPTVDTLLLAAIPATPFTKGNQREKKSTLLQSYDLESDTQTSRQALTRNVTTAVNMAPSGQPVQEPNVTNIAVSFDGKWLATVEEWQPNEQDVAPMWIDADSPARRGAATETSLRLWIMNNDDNNWEMVTRIDEPHKPGPRSVLGIAMNPARLELATIGTDASISIWSPKARQRDDVSVRDRKNKQLYTWTCTMTIPCEQDALGKVATAVATSATLAYSDDGSVLAASWSWPSTLTRFVHLIDPRTGRLCASQPGLLQQGDARLAFCGRYLVCLSQMLVIHDTLTSQNTTTIELDQNYLGPEYSSSSYLAVNKLDQKVAVSLTKTSAPKSTKLVIFSIIAGDIKPLYESSLAGGLKSLLALTTRPGFLMIDDRNVYRSLKPSGTSALSSVLGQAAAASQEPDQVTKSLDSIFGTVGSLVENEKTIKDGGEDNTTSSSRDLNGALRIVSSAQAPSPAELFQRVLTVLAQS
ncbi:NET1-associated nuclear protein 1 [Knufia peltigerae]|uniref:NET1-associated nuclear protein 1 n=1 Tax=Knufia peltigerae TaxID=1002370 RepID=A0AA39CVV0_9EURO|nr:NET1-associated nuclear protein 1 [Knufia peltigerae]